MLLRTHFKPLYDSLRCFNCQQCGEYLQDKVYRISVCAGLVCARCKDALAPGREAGAQPYGYVLQRPVIAPQVNTCAWCTEAVYEAERVRAFGQVYHPLCFKCGACGAGLGSVESAHSFRGQPHCHSCYRQHAHPAAPAIPRPPVDIDGCSKGDVLPVSGV